MHDRKQYKPTERFSNRAKHYSQARPNYPKEALDFIRKHCGLNNNSHVCDIGAGTGISSRALAACGFRVTAVEPNQAMLEEARQNPEFAELIDYVRGSAENSGLDAASFEAIICAQAFHWFEPALVLPEFRRLLKPAGWLVLIWNERDESDEFTRNYGDLLRSLPETAAVEMKRGKAGQPLLDSELFANTTRQSFSNLQLMDLDKLKGRALSASYAPPPESAEAETFCRRLAELFESYQNDGTVTMKYECSVFTGQKGRD